MAGTYCQHEDVRTFLQLKNAFDDDSTPTSTIVDTWISWAEDHINQMTKTAWKEVVVTNEHQTMEYFPDIVPRRQRPRVVLKHRPLQTFTSGTHKIEVWDGDDWVDWALAANGKTMARDGDYWINYEDGIIQFVKGYPRDPFYQGVRVTYRYGYSTVEAWVERWCTLLVARKVCQFSRKKMLSEGGATGSPEKVTLDRQIANITEEINQIEKDNRYIYKDVKIGFISG